MAETYGEYAGFVRKGGKTVGYQKMTDGRMQLVKTDSVPEEIRAYLTERLLGRTEDEVQVLPRTTEPAGLHPIPSEVDYPTKPTAENTSAIGVPILTDLEMARQALEEMNGKTIYDASIKDMAEALYERFGVYTAYLNRFPGDDEINPFTARPMTKYERGVAYQSFIRVMNSGILNTDLEEVKKSIDASHAAANDLQGGFIEPPHTFADHRAADSFDYRTSVEGDNERNAPKTHMAHYTDKDGVVHTVRVEIEQNTTEGNGAISVPIDDQFGSEPVVQPQFGKQVIRPNW